MKRFAVLLLLLILPLQYSWAALGAYCQHEGGAGAQQHFGHHVHQHEQAGGKEPASGSPAFHPDCALCHLGSTGIEVLPLLSACDLVPIALAAGEVHFPLGEIVSRPEKPKWHAAG